MSVPTTYNSILTSVTDDRKVSSSKFYSEYHGHLVEHLEILLPNLRATSDSLIWTAGDSSLDNKHWFEDTQPAVGAYMDVLSPPQSKCDVTYWLNYVAQERGVNRMAAINTAVEATTLNERSFRLREQDKFLRDNIREDDILIVSIGGNDVALAPTPCTIFNMLCLLKLPLQWIENGCSCGTVPFDDKCFGCGPSLLSCFGSFPPFAGYFLHLFGPRIESYIRKLTEKTKPRTILVCMIYYPDQNPTPSWANLALGALGYNSNPKKLQAMIRLVFQRAISNIRIPGTQVIPVPLFSVLDGTRSEDYVERVEPSALGGSKMANFIWDIIMERKDPILSPVSPSGAPPLTTMTDRE
jgi:hypothetical protein